MGSIHMVFHLGFETGKSIGSSLGFIARLETEMNLIIFQSASQITGQLSLGQALLGKRKSREPHDPHREYQHERGGGNPLPDIYKKPNHGEHREQPKRFGTTY